MRYRFEINNCVYTLIKNDCLKEMSGSLDDNFIDLIAVDLPYGVTQNKWDIPIPLDIMWSEFKRILKTNGVVVLTATQPFTSKLVMSNLGWFKYETIWKKTVGSGQLNINNRPLRIHESILVFYRNQPTYNEQRTKGKPYFINRKTDYGDGCYGAQKNHQKMNVGFRHAKSVVEIPNPRIKDGHPTQKPVELMEYIIKTYSNKNDIVLDCCMGHGTTGVACINLGRHFIGIEINESYFNSAIKNIKSKKLF